MVLLTMHHIVSDGWSMGVLLNEVNTLYAFSRGEPSPLPEPVLQYADYAVWQREWLQGEVLECLTGGSNWKVLRRCWSCRQTGHALPSRPSVERMNPGTLSGANG